MDLFKEIKSIRYRKGRPDGKISSKGNYGEMLEKTKKIANELLREKGVIGITHQFQ